MRHSILTACGLFSKFRHKFKKHTLLKGNGIIKKLENDIPTMGAGKLRHVLKFKM